MRTGCVCVSVYGVLPLVPTRTGREIAKCTPGSKRWQLLLPAPPNGMCGWQPKCHVVLGSSYLGLEVMVASDGGLTEWPLGVFKEVPKGQHLPTLPLPMGNTIPALGVGCGGSPMTPDV